MIIISKLWRQFSESIYSSESQVTAGRKTISSFVVTGFNLLSNRNKCFWKRFFKNPYSCFILEYLPFFIHFVFMTILLYSHCQRQNRIYQYRYWRLREFFGRKPTFFLICVSKDSPCSCDHFHTKLFVVGGRLRRRNRRKQPKRNQSHLICDVINDVSLISHTSSDSPWSEL